MLCAVQASQDQPFPLSNLSTVLLIELQADSCCNVLSATSTPSLHPNWHCDPRLALIPSSSLCPPTSLHPISHRLISRPFYILQHLLHFYNLHTHSFHSWYHVWVCTPSTTHNVFPPSTHYHNTSLAPLPYYLPTPLCWPSYEPPSVLLRYNLLPLPRCSCLPPRPPPSSPSTSPERCAYVIK